jgi:hypothetical protein
LQSGGLLLFSHTRCGMFSPLVGSRSVAFHGVAKAANSAKSKAWRGFPRGECLANAGELKTFAATASEAGSASSSGRFAGTGGQRRGALQAATGRDRRPQAIYPRSKADRAAERFLSRLRRRSRV